MANAPPLQDATRLQEIAADLYGGRIDRPAAREAVIDVVPARLECARVGLWRFEADVQALRAIATRISLLMSSHADPALWDAPSLPMRPLAAS